LGQNNVEAARVALDWCRKLGISVGSRWDLEYYWVLHNSRDYAEAAAYCERVVAEDPSDLVPLVFLAHVRGVHLGDFADAEATLRKALSENPVDVNVHYFLADILARQKKYEEAEQEYLVARSRVFTSEDVLQVSEALVKLYLASGQLSKASEIYQPLLERTDISAALLNTIAWGLYKVGGSHLQEARQLAKKAVELSPADLGILQTYAAILVRLDDWNAAHMPLRNFLATSSGQRWREMWRDDVLMLQDAYRFGRAKEFVEAIKSVPQDPEMYAVIEAMQIAAGTLGINDVVKERQSAVESIRQQVVDGTVSDFPISSQLREK
jgi:tetratricopeptide (TPR) repeat protein